MSPGLTEADLERIERYLRLPPERRRPSALRPEDDETFPKWALPPAAVADDRGWIRSGGPTRAVDEPPEAKPGEDRDDPGIEAELSCPGCETDVPLRTRACPRCGCRLH